MKRIYCCFAATAVILAALLALSPVLVPMIVDMDSVKERIRSTLNEKTGVDVDFREIVLTPFPGPGIVVRDARFQLAGEGARGTVEEVHVYPRILSLMSGTLRIGRVSLKDPRVEFSFAKQTSTQEMPFPDPAVLKELTASLLRSLALHAPGLQILIDDGSADIYREKKAIMSFSAVKGSIHLPPGDLEANLSLSSNMWHHARIKGYVNSENLSGKCSIKLEGFKPHLIANTPASWLRTHIEESLVDVELNLDYDGTVMSGNTVGAIHNILFERGGVKLDMHDVHIKLNMHLSPGLSEISLTSLVSRGLNLDLSGNLKIDADAEDISLDVRGRNIYVKIARRAAYFFAGDIKGVRTAFEIVREGRVPMLSFQTRGRSFKTLGDVSHLKLKGQLRDGVIYLPWRDLMLRDAAGDITIEDGTLKGQSMEARFDSSAGKNGTLVVGLSGKQPVFHLAADIQADLAGLPAFLKRIINKSSLDEELSLIHDLTGKTAARLVLSGRIGSISTEVDASMLDVAARYERIPYPVVIRKCRLSYKSDTLSVRDLKGSIGGSSFSSTNVEVGWRGTTEFNVDSRSMTVDLAEIFHWLVSLDALKDHLAGYAPVKGKVLIDSLQVSGPASSPGEWKFKTTGTARDLSAVVPSLKTLVDVESGRFTITEEDITFSDVHASGLDASGTVSGEIKKYRQGISQAELKIDGTFGTLSIKRFAQIAKVGPEIEIQSPLTLSRVNLLMRREDAISISGEISSRDGSRISGDILLRDREIRVTDLTIADGKDRANVSASIGNGKAKFRFSGRLEKKMVDRFVLLERYPWGWIEGDIDADIDLNQTGRSNVQGVLEGEDIPIPPRMESPLRVKTFSVHGDGKSLSINSADVVWVDTYLIVTGEVRSEPDGLVADARIFADRLSWETLKMNAKKESKQEQFVEKEKGEKSWDLPVTGRVIVNANSFVYDTYEMRPFQAEILIDRNHVGIEIIESTVCGIDMKGTLSITPSTVSFIFEPAAQDADLRRVLSCVQETDSVMTGTFDLSGNMTSDGESDHLLENMTGTISFTSRDGRIHRMTLLSNILSIVNVTEVFLGKIPDLRGEGLAYNELLFHGHFEKGRFIIEEALLDGKNLELAGQGRLDLRTREIEMKVLVAPLKTIDRIIKLIPIVRDILGGTLISIPVSVEGNVDDPEVTVLSPSAIGEGVLNLFKRILELPFKIIEPVLPDEKDPQQ